MTKAPANDIAHSLQKCIEQGELELPVLPEVASQVLSLARDDNADAAALARLIQSDQALAGHIMRVANSSAYNTVSPMVTLQQAIARLGMQVVADMAIAASVGPKLFDAPGKERYIADLWRHSLAAASWAREIARVARSNVESTFLCGLLYQIGRPVVLQILLKIAHRDGIDLVTEQLETLISQYQKVVGVSIARQWKLPEPVVETINYIDDYYAAPSAKEQVMMVCAARLFADVLLLDEDIDAEDLCGKTVLSDLNLYVEDVQALLDKQDAINDSLEAFLS